MICIFLKFTIVFTSIFQWNYIRIALFSMGTFHFRFYACIIFWMSFQNLVFSRIHLASMMMMLINTGNKIFWSLFNHKFDNFDKSQFLWHFCLKFFQIIWKRGRHISVISKLIKKRKEIKYHNLLCCFEAKSSIDASFSQIRRNPYFRLMMRIEENILKTYIKRAKFLEKKLKSLETFD